MKGVKAFDPDASGRRPESIACATVSGRSRQSGCGSFEESFLASSFWLAKLRTWLEGHTEDLYQAMLALEGQEVSGAGPIRLHHQDEHGSFVTYEFLRRKVFKQWAIDKGLVRGLLRHVWQPSLDGTLSVGDFGAGGGHYSKWLNETGLVEAFAFDGTHQAAELTDGLVQEVNLVQEMRLWRSFDWVLCLEVGEHVPKQYAATLLSNLKRHALQGLVMSWSDDWEGIGHVNCLSREEFVAFVQQSTGFVLDEVATEAVRSACEIDYIARTLAVFRAPKGRCDPSANFYGMLGVSMSIVLANLGAAYGTAKSGVGIANLGVMRPDMVMRSIIPVVMAGVLGIYGLITAVIINGKIHPPSYSAYSGYAHLAAGITVGMSSLAAGMAIGVVGDAGVRANAQQPRLFVGMILILIFAEALGLYGLIVGLVVASTAEGKGSDLCIPWDSSK
ncbi:unnamed protein product [Effrenium voratum]|nr:unnamed protein product [Effrenium voratum]